MQFKSFNLLIIALTIHIFSVHCKLLYYLNPEVANKHPFSFINFDEATVLAIIFALAYSLATSSVLFNTGRKSIIFIFATLDSIGVLLYYFTKIPIYFGAIYFAIYTGILIMSIAYLQGADNLSFRILSMKNQGLTQREIASKLNLSESKISRTLKGSRVA